MDIARVPFGYFKGEPVTKYVLTNDNGVQAGILDFAGLLQSFKVPTKDGGKADMVLTSENLDEFTNNGFCTNRLIGRVAGRIAHGEFKVFGKDFKVFSRNGVAINMNSRMETLLLLFGLDDLITADDELPQRDWAQVGERLEQRRAESRAWLESALGIA